MSRASVGVIGAGLMGSGMADCLLRAGHPVQVLVHRGRTQIAPLLRRGAREAPDARAMLAQCDVLLTCVPNAETVQDLADTLVPLFREGQIWIDASTSRPDTSAGIAERLVERGAIFADAPVTGGPQQAQEGTLVSLVGCTKTDFPTIEALVAPYSKTVRRFGDAGRGHAAKLLNNLVSQGTMLLLADAFQSASQIGVDAEALYDVMMAGAARSGTLEKAVGPALRGDYDGSRFSIANAEKDLRYVRDLLAAQSPPRDALAAALAERLGSLVDQGRGAEYVSSMLDPDTP